MTWHVLASQDLTDDYSHGPDAGELGVAVWRVRPAPPEEGQEESSVDLVLFELDLAADGESGRNDRLAEFTLTYTGEQDLTVSGPREASGNDPRLVVCFLLENEDGPPDGRTKTIRIHTTDDPDYRLELGLRVGDAAGSEETDEVRLLVGAVPEFVPPGDYDRACDWPPEVGAEGTLPPRQSRNASGELVPTTVRGRAIEWDGDSAYVRATQRTRIKITNYGRYWGLLYYGRWTRPAFTDRAAGQAERRYLHESDPPEYFRAVASQGFRVMAEGGYSAINTYDGFALTLGMGFAGGRLKKLLNRARGTPCGDLLAPAFAPNACFSDDLEFNSDMINRAKGEAPSGESREARRERRAPARELMWDVNALVQFIRIAEHPHYGMLWAALQVEELVEYNALGIDEEAGTEPDSGDLDWANAHAADWRTEHKYFRALVGVAMYLRHGTQGYMQNPLADIRFAVDQGQDQPFRMLAILFQLVASRMAFSKVRRFMHYQRERNPRTCLFGTRIAQFEGALRDDHVASWRLSDEENRAAFEGLIPCLGSAQTARGRSSWVLASTWDVTTRLASSNAIGLKRFSTDAARDDWIRFLSVDRNDDDHVTRRELRARSRPASNLRRRLEGAPWNGQDRISLTDAMSYLGHEPPEYYDFGELPGSEG